LRKRVSKLKSAAETKKSIARHESAYHINKEGAGQVVIVGATNVGKSALVAALTHAAPQVAGFPHTTWKPSPGMMPVENIQIQLIDTPPLSREYVDPEMMDLIRRCDLILLMVDLQTDPLQQFENTVALLEENHIVPLATIVERLNIIRVYSKSPGKKPDRSSPFVLKIGSTIADFAVKVHQDFATKLKSAKVWGPSVFDGQMVQRNYVLHDGDVVELQI
jgi:ribosome-interacting GTPase 1